MYLIFFRIPIPLNFPTFQLNAKVFQEKRELEVEVVNKCFLILSAEPKDDAEQNILEEIVNSVINHVKEYPKIIMVSMKNEGLTDYGNAFIRIRAPIIWFNLRSQIFTLFCADRNRKVLHLWHLLEEKQLYKMCPKGKEDLRIGYNNHQPFFEMINDQPDMKSLEAIIITTFVEAHQLNAKWIWAGNKWGSKGADGRFNGVVGKVRLIFSIHA